MKVRLYCVIALSVLLTACNAAAPPRDANGQTPQEVLMQTYQLILQGQYAEAQKHFSADFVQELITNNNSTFVEYCGNTKGWRPDWLKVKLVGNDYNDNLWRVKIIPDEGKGAHNGPGIVQDMYMIDGSWKIVFWGHYTKT